MKHSTDGTYTVQFQSSLGLFGAGVVTLSNLEVSGGDSGFLFAGAFKEVGSELVGAVSVSQHADGMISIFGPMRNFELSLCGQITNGIGQFTGSMVGMPQMKIKVVLQQSARKVA
ncbi:GrlR family regulatory protein [uncultured Roseobacter sp.]|uniref:GrlR family regulatory protein n=1 Tax=uncultured Roseobacter sp. TaxID=114847 RepID=UPI00261816A6|nr:GrlR family regulatory protein [uncultured Roseobacter sp.]